MPTLAEWQARITATGVVYHPPDSRTVAGVRVTERVRPIRRVRDVVRLELEQMHAGEIIRDESVGPIEVLRTAEGEHAALVSVKGTGVVDGCALLYCFGFVFAEDFFHRIDGWMTEEARFAELDEVMRDAIKTSHLCLGAHRHRLYHYDPPPGWQGLARGPLLTEWYPLAFPRHHARLSIPAAFVKKEAPALVEALMSRRLTAFTRSDKFMFENVTIGGMKGLIQLRMGSFPLNAAELRSTHMVHVVLSDSTYTYMMRLDTTKENLESDRHVLFALLKSVQGVPSSVEHVAESVAWMID